MVILFIAFLDFTLQLLGLLEVGADLSLQLLHLLLLLFIVHRLLSDLCCLSLQLYDFLFFLPQLLAKPGHLSLRDGAGGAALTLIVLIGTIGLESEEPTFTILINLLLEFANLVIFLTKLIRQNLQELGITSVNIGNGVG